MAGLVGALAAIERGAGLVGATIAAAIAVLGAFGSWALTRELVPDDDPAAFVSMVASLGAIWIFERPGVLILFATMGLVRLVNRTVGLPPRRSDSVVVLLFALIVAWVTPSPWFALVAAVAAELAVHRRWHLMPLVPPAALGVGIVALSAPIGPQYQWVATIGVTAIAFATLRSDGRGDADLRLFVPGSCRASHRSARPAARPALRSRCGPRPMLPTRPRAIPAVP